MDGNEIRRYKRMVEKQTGVTTEQYTRMDGNDYHEDGFVNVMTKYGTAQDSSTQYQFVPEVFEGDIEMEHFYEGNGLFAKIIDAPAEEAIKHGFEFDEEIDSKLERYIRYKLELLDWEESAIKALKWTRLFGGALIVMLIDDGKGLEEPVDWNRVQSIKDLKVYDRSVVVPDYASMFRYEGKDPFHARGSGLGTPERYWVYSKFGAFTVHESRCLVFKNGELPEKCTNSIFQMWGMPEYMRIHKAVRDVEIAHGLAPKMLDRSVQAIYTMTGLAQMLATEQGEDMVMKRLQTIDMARGLLNTIVLDADGEGYDFKSFSYTGASDVINTTCNYLSAVTNIPQTILFGRSPAGMNATGESDLENYYNYVERMQKKTLKSNLRYLIGVILRSAKNRGKIEEVPKINIQFSPLWSLSETDRVALDAQKASVEATKAQTASTYVQMQAIDPSEVRRKLSEDGEYDIETMLEDFTEEELAEHEPQQQGGDPNGDPMAMMGGGDPSAMTGGGGAPSDMGDLAQMMGGGAPQVKEAPNMEGKPKTAQNEEKGAKKVNPKGNAPTAEKIKPKTQQEEVKEDEDDIKHAVGVIVVKDGKILTATRMKGMGTGTIGGAGGHCKVGEKSMEAAKRETMEEFGIMPKDLLLIGRGNMEESGLTPDIYLCTEYEGDVTCDDVEMTHPVWRDIKELNVLGDKLFKPFADSIERLKQKAKTGLYGFKESWND